MALLNRSKGQYIFSCFGDAAHKILLTRHELIRKAQLTAITLMLVIRDKNWNHADRLFLMELQKIFLPGYETYLIHRCAKWLFKYTMPW